MDTSHFRAESFSQARQQKRLIFQALWNRFVQGPLFLSAVLSVTVAQGFFLIFSGSFLLEQALLLGILGQNYPFWCNIIIFALQLLLSAPGCLFVTGLWHLRRHTHWKEESTPDCTGLKLMKWTNTALCAVTGIVLALYPTIIITAGEYLKQWQIYQLFYLLLSSSLLFVLCFCFVRPVIRTGEENITCCWAGTAWLLPLILAIAAVLAAVLWLLPLTKPFYAALALLIAACGFLLSVYWSFLRRAAYEQAQIDQQVIAHREDPNDPYSRY